MKKIESDVIIVGCGVSGLTVAIKAAQSGLSVNIITKEKELYESNTFYAQGGVIGLGEKDSSEILFNDIMKAGSQLNYKDAVQFVSESGPKMVDDFLLKEIGVDFDKNINGSPELTREAAHTVRRIYHNGDETGKSIQQGLISKAKEEKNISFFKNSMAIDLITNCHNSTLTQERYKQAKVMGIYSLDIQSGDVHCFFAPSVVLATGGAGRVFKFTSNPATATGDGIAMAYRSGVSIINAEYVQFHPTTIFHRDMKNFLLSESLRGEGAVLRNRNGDTFMKNYHPDGDLAPRDEVSIGITHEMEKTNSDYILLDATTITNCDPAKRFPGIFRTCMSLGIDIRKEPIPSVPAAHYFCGGIKTTLEGKTNIDGLYAVGECACTGLHGANRLASTSLLEGVAFGIIVGEQLKKNNHSLNRKLIQSIPDWISPSSRDEFDHALIVSDLTSIQETMWNYAGIIRTPNRLDRALSDINYFTHRIEKFYREAALRRDVLELRNAVVTAKITAQAARNNPISKGCHYIRK